MARSARSWAVREVPFAAGPRFGDGPVPLLVTGAAAADQVERWRDGVWGARAEWTKAFGGEQHSLGRAFYTHLEEGRLDAYFADAAASDARVEAAAPGLQEAMRRLFAAVAGGATRPRRDFCGPGAHVFSSRDKVARVGGVVHFDTEGLPQHHRERGRPALSVVLTLSAPSRGGGLRLWDLRYAGADAVDDEALAQAASVDVRAAPGDAVVFDSYTLHQILPFAGRAPRITVTVHGAEVEAGLWETWF